jgi:hypothetical protein
MSYILKLKAKDGTETVYPGVDHFQVTPLLTKSGQSAVGLEIDMITVDAEGDRTHKLVKLPQDGADLYLTSDESPATLDSWHWPPHPKKVGKKSDVRQVFRVTEASERSKQNHG